MKFFTIGFLFLIPFLSFAQTDELAAIFENLFYNSGTTYSSGSAVMISLEDGEIYTSIIDVPAAADGSNGPSGANSSTYWSDSTTTTQKFENDNPTFLTELPSDINTTALSEAVAELINPDSLSEDHPSAILSCSLDWFGLRFEKGNWAYHSLYGFIYFNDLDTEDEIWFYIPPGAGDLPASWNWTATDIFPHVFNSVEGWLEFSGPEFFLSNHEFWDDEPWAITSGEPLLENDPDEESWDGLWDEENWGVINFNFVDINDMVYSPHNFYESGDVVITNLKDGQFYQAIKEVPWSESESSYSPDGPSGSIYWQDFDQTVLIIEEENPDFLSQFPSDIDTQSLRLELDGFWEWYDEEHWDDNEVDGFFEFYEDLLYNPLIKYPAGSAVLLEINDGEIYTSKIDVPAGISDEDDTYSPEGPNSREYWASTYETTLTFEINNPDFTSVIPRSFDTLYLSKEVARWVEFDKEKITTIDDVFAGLLYDPNKFYLIGDAVVIDVEGGEIFTAKKKVPADPDGINAPNGENSDLYWLSNFETTELFEAEHGDFWRNLPDDIHWDDLHVEVSKLTVPTDRDSDNDGLSDYLELFQYKTNPEIDDSDEDGLPDHLEIELGSDPAESDEELVNYLKSLTEEQVKRSIFDNLNSHGLVTREEYDQIQEKIEFSKDSNATPYTPDWFYVPERGWMWTSQNAYPYIYDKNSSSWLYFQSGNEKPLFYNYQSKDWETIE